MEDFGQLVADKFQIKDLFPYQLEVLEVLISGKSAFVCQRTGRGKSLCYEAFTTAAKLGEAMVLVVSPLIAIMEEQVEFLNSLDIPAVMLGKTQKMDSDAKDGKYQYIYGSPETFLARDDWRKSLKSKIFQDRTKLIVVDEAHLVIQW